MRGIMWFRHDLRLHDNPALMSVSQRCEQALFLYVFDPDWFTHDRFGSRHLGEFRLNFLLESLEQLHFSLAQKNQHLAIKVGKPKAVISQLCDKHKIGFVGVNSHPGVYERRDVARCQMHLTAQVHCTDSFTLYLREQIAPYIEEFPATFSQFRRRIQKQNLQPGLPVSAPYMLPEPLVEGSDILPHTNGKNAEYAGGERTGLQRLADYVAPDGNIEHYKETRNGFEGWQFSSRLSAWLANGSLSVRKAMADIMHWEVAEGETSSSKALKDELLWREFFQWMQWHYEAKLFSFRGINNRKPLTTYYANRFRAWQNGNTDYPIVNACMNQLKETGWLSNRGRQIAASCLVNELGIDWRYGAAWFEQQLIDFDVASNYGNWQYLAGVGADPKGPRHFNLEKQAEYYDPDGTFRKRWSGTPSLKDIELDPFFWEL